MLFYESFPFVPFVIVLPNVNSSLCVFETSVSLALSESIKALFKEFPKPSYVLSSVNKVLQQPIVINSKTWGKRKIISC